MHDDVRPTVRPFHSDLVTNVPPVPTQSNRGRGLLIAGAVLMALSIVGGAALLSLIGRQIDIQDLNRDVKIEGSRDRLVPGTLEFEVLERLDGSDKSGEMSVGVAIPRGASPEPDCTIASAAASDELGGEDLSARARSDDALLSSGNTTSDTVLVVARLQPGEYVAECTMAGEPSASSGVSFTVGRVLRPTEVFEDFGALFGAMGVLAIAGLMFLVGLVLLIIGFVLRARSRRTPQYQYGQQYPPYPQQQYPGQQYPGHQYPQQPHDPYGQQYPQPPYPQQPPSPQQQPYPQQPQPTYEPPSYEAPPTEAPPYEPPTYEQPAAPESDDGGSGWTVPPSKN